MISFHTYVNFKTLSTLIGTIFIFHVSFTQNLLTNPGFENGEAEWTLNKQSFGCDRNVVDEGYLDSKCLKIVVTSTNITSQTFPNPAYPNPATGVVSASQRMNFTPGFRGISKFRALVGDPFCILRHEFTFKKGHTYSATIGLKSPNNITVEFMLRRAGAHYDAAAVRRVTVGSDWQQVTITGGFEEDTPGFLGINFLSPGELYVDDASLIDITDVTNQSIATVDSIPASLFGIHLNRLGTHNVWPAINAGTLRIWASGTAWNDLEPENNQWNFGRLDYFVNHASGNSPEAKIIYTFGYSPSWASKTSSPDIGTAPNLGDWSDFVAAIGNRCRGNGSDPCSGKITYFEMWNEANLTTFWKGSVSEMVEMTHVARDILKGIDPSIQIIAPNVSIYGYPWLEEFLSLGGGQYVDIFSFHDYMGKTPEASIPKIKAMRDIMNAYGQQNKPLWNTEGTTGLSAGESTPETVMPVDDAVASVARAYIIQWLHGVSNFNWYAWEGEVMGPSHPMFTDQLSGYQAMLPPAIAYRETANWLVRSSIKGLTVQGDVWEVTLKTKENFDALIVWSTAQEYVDFEAPPGMLFSEKRLLDGTLVSYSSPVDIDLIGTKPVFLKLTPASNSGGRFSRAEDVVQEVITPDLALRSYPNPFSGTTTITYQINEDTHVKLSLYPVYGKKISDIANSHHEKGSHEIILNGEGLTNGVYLVRLETNKGQAIAKIILLK